MTNQKLGGKNVTDLVIDELITKFLCYLPIFLNGINFRNTFEESRKKVD
jgi:hypothetical protein